MTPIFEKALALGVLTGSDLSLYWAGLMSRSSGDVMTTVVKGLEANGEFASKLAN
jgi:hypothetical protein